MFRVSPWIQYDPNGETQQDHSHLTRTDNIRFRSMNEDIEMDAPQISTLRDDETPPPQPARTGKFRVKLVMGDNKRAGSSAAGPSPRKRESDEDEDDEDEEDQLIDDDDDEPRVPAPAAAAALPAPTTNEKRGTGAKRGTGVGRGRGRGRGAKAKLGGRAGTYPQLEAWSCYKTVRIQILPQLHCPARVLKVSVQLPCLRAPFRPSVVPVLPRSEEEDRKLQASNVHLVNALQSLCHVFNAIHCYSF